MPAFELIFLAVALAMDAFCVSLSDGLKEKKMKKGKVFLIALVFGLMQGLMPMIGYFAGYAFSAILDDFIPYIALYLLMFLGGKMIYDSQKKECDDDSKKKSRNAVLEIFIQGFATSIDALTVGVLFLTYDIPVAILDFAIISAITFIICLAGVLLGKKFGHIFGNKAVILGGVILIIIGLKIFIEYRTGLLV